MSKNSRLKLRCYCCGTPITGEGVSLVVQAGNLEVDRVFVFLPSHADKADGIYLNAWLDKPEEKRRGKL